MHDDTLKARNIYKKIGKKKLARAMRQRYYPYTHTIFLGGCFLGFVALRMLLTIPTLLLLGVILAGIAFTFTKISKQFALNIARMEYRLTTDRARPLRRIEEKIYLHSVYREIKRTAKLIDYLNHPEFHYTNAIAFDKFGNKLWPIKIPFILHTRIKESELALKQTLLNPKAYRSQALGLKDIA
ncbi:hypothetical protein [Entomospira culicis]|uniref:Uncharacterized protein n=1 Tax=Entomospira culicis TaxID=2719989 RepID=A0A968KUB8_9SPIO|nr:hypothetical protein [Entomospira culicis]NIZ18745.1 hypothetical protein [Entomospira culicis]NIZ68960.1 hypothetical protein [Entomospira culicis]WDI37552.1 hypothetical protein PVA46_01830 [Entomospira culicis]WDI39180.1 hypothetical protein PVA47_01835 [Entomospira culicis]